MKNEKSIFQIIIFAIFAFSIVAAVLIFATMSSKSGTSNIGKVVLWGTFDARMMEQYLQVLKDTDPKASKVRYVQIAAEQFQSKLAEALANGKGPDVFFITQDTLLQNIQKIQQFSYKSISRRTYRDTYIDEAEIFLSNNGINALPFAMDPMVLYWNRDMFAEAGLAKPPTFWDQLFKITGVLTRRDRANNITQATIAFGEYDNVSHAKDIITMLIMQAGGAIVGVENNGKLSSKLDTSGFGSNKSSPAQTALLFYTTFADPSRNTYTWNRSLLLSIDSFTQGKLALYLGYASDKKIIEEKNAHLNYDIAPMPQIRAGKDKKILTFGKMYAIAVPKIAKNRYGGNMIAYMLASKKASALFSKMENIPSPRRDLLSSTPKGAGQVIFRNAALISHAWIDPDAKATSDIFRQMVGGITSGALKIGDAISKADAEMNILLK